MRLEIHALDFPGRRCTPADTELVYENVHVGVQRRKDVVDLVPGDAPSASWTFDVDVKDVPELGVDFRGPHVQGRRGDRFFYLSWGSVDEAGNFEMFRRAKLMLDALDPAVLAAARRPGARLVGRLGLTDDCGLPRCAAVRPPVITWAAEVAGG